MGEDNPFLAALPELANLNRYGGATLEENVRAASIRARQLREEIKLAVTKARSYNARNSILGSNYEVSPDEQILGDPITNTGALLGAITRNIGREPRLRTAVRSLNGDLATPINQKDVAFIVQFLRYDDPNKSVSDIVAERLQRGLRLVPKADRRSAVGEVIVPFKIDKETGVVAPAIDAWDYSNGLSALDSYISTRTLPSSLDSRKISVRIASTQADFEEQYREISPTERDLSGAQGVNFATRDGKEVTRSGINSGFEDKSTVILLNHDNIANTKGEFGGSNAIAETIIHEYGHTVHRTMGLTWGDPQVGDTNPKTSEYAGVRSQKVSDYGENNDQEHFAETFAKYIYTGSGTPEFESFLENHVGIKKVNVEDIYPALFVGDQLKSDFVRKMQEADLGGWRIRNVTFSQAVNGNSSDLLRSAQNIIMNGGDLPHLQAMLTGSIYDEQGRPVGTFTRVFHREPNGKMYVYHQYFKLTDESAQGNGFGSKFMDASFQLYDSWGFDRAEVTAGLDNGPYMWGITGFDFTNENDRESKLSHLRRFINVLSEYNKHAANYDNSPLDVVVGQMMEDNPQINGSGAMEILRIARNNGWKIDNNFINELEYLLSLPKSQATAQRIANLGRKNKKELTKNYDSIGRHIMMKSGWKGVLYVKDYVPSGER